MIYILGKYYLYDDDKLDEVIKVISNNIQDILDYLNIDNIPYYHMLDYALIISNEKSHYEYTIRISENMLQNLEKFPNELFFDDYEEFKDMKNRIANWCSDISDAIKLINEQILEQEEEKERKLYEQLKAKYGE